MEVKRKRETTLYSLFLRYLVTFCTLIFIVAFFLVIFFYMGLNNGILLPANYAQNQIDKIKKADTKLLLFSEKEIPYPCKYAFYENDMFIRGNLDKSELKDADQYLIGESFKSNSIYTKIEFKDGICIVKYDIRAHFSSEFWNRLIPYPELLLGILFGILFIIIASILAIKFGKRLKKELYPLKDSTERIMKQELDFEILQSNIREFNDVLKSIADMKGALKESLEIQWKAEVQKREQIGALAHDIKTPLTIIRGNAELLYENDILKEDREYINYIIKNSDKIEKYLSILIEVSKSENELKCVKGKIISDIFFKELNRELNMLCKVKNIKTFFKTRNIPESFSASEELLTRAIMNIMDNAVEHSPINSEIEFYIFTHEDKLIFTVNDSGTGFTEEGLKNATNQFYMEQRERKVGEHYGMGLYIAESIVKKHGGYLVVKNRINTQGAKVSIVIPIL